MALGKTCALDFVLGGCCTNLLTYDATLRTHSRTDAPLTLLALNKTSTGEISVCRVIRVTGNINRSQKECTGQSK